MSSLSSVVFVGEAFQAVVPDWEVKEGEKEEAKGEEKEVLREREEREIVGRELRVMVRGAKALSVGAKQMLERRGDE